MESLTGGPLAEDELDDDDDDDGSSSSSLSSSSTSKLLSSASDNSSSSESYSSSLSLMSLSVSTPTPPPRRVERDSKFQPRDERCFFRCTNEGECECERLVKLNWLDFVDAVAADRSGDDEAEAAPGRRASDAIIRVVFMLLLLLRTADRIVQYHCVS